MSHPPAPPAATGAAHGLYVDVVTPEGLAFEGRAVSVVVPAHDGEVAFLPGHAAYVGALGFGELRVTTREGEVRRWYLEGGVAEVAAGRVTVLAERVLTRERVDAARALADLERALARVPTDEAAQALRDRALRSAHGRLRFLGGGAAGHPSH